MQIHWKIEKNPWMGLSERKLYEQLRQYHKGLLVQVPKTLRIVQHTYLISNTLRMLDI